MAIGIGETLRAARRERGAELSDAAAATRIRQRYLVALEDEDFEALGEEVYVRGFLRSYASYLGVAPEPLLAEYRARFHREQEHAVAVSPAVPARTPLPRTLRAAVAAGTLVLLLAVVAVAGDRDRSPPPEPRPPAVTQVATAPATATPTLPPTTPSPTAAATPTDPQPAEGVEVRLVVDGGASWVRVTVDDQVVLEETLATGSARTFRGEAAVVLRLGDAGVVLLTVDGEDLGPAGGPGEVLDLAFGPAVTADPDG